MQDANHLLQYREPDTKARRSTVLCPDHRGVLMEHLRAEGVGCSGALAPPMAKCDVCHD